MLRRRRAWAGAILLTLSSLILFGAAEGPQKWQWIEAGLVPNVLLTLGFVFPGRGSLLARGRSATGGARSATRA